MKNKDLLEIKKKLIKLSNNSLSPQVLEDIAGLNLSKKDEVEILSFVKKKNILSNLNKVYAIFEEKKEVGISKELIKNPKMNWKNFYPLPSKYIQIVKEEIKKLKLSKNDHIVITGSGSFPATAISFSDYTNAKITCIEKNPKYAKLSKKALSSLGYNKVDVICADSSKVNYKDFTVVLITLLTEHKRETIKKVCLTSNCRILLRSAKGIINLIYPEIDKKIINKFKIVDCLQQGYILRFGKKSKLYPS